MEAFWRSHYVAAGTAFVVALLLTPVLRAAANRLGLLDRANDRSSHRGAVPRGGGVGIIAAVLCALALARPDPGGPITAVILGALSLAALGFCDDLFSLPAGLRAAAQAVVALAIVASLGGLDRLPLPQPLDRPLGILGMPLTVLWIVSVVNFFNFLDGIDGLAAAQAAITGLGIMLAAWDPPLALLAAAVAGAAAGFLPFNWAPASVFLGDVGSYFLGFVLAALPVAAPPEQRPNAVLFVMLSLSLFLIDAFWTMTRRLLRGERVHEAHREHLYQQLARRWGHAPVALAIAAGSTVVTGAALAAWRNESGVVAWSALVLAVAVSAGEYLVAARWRTA